jgi:hypothetical protein
MIFLDSPNSITFTTLSFGFLSMSLAGILACCFRMKCNEVEMCKCFKMTRDITAENQELEIERRNRDVIPGHNVSKLFSDANLPSPDNV